MTRTIVGIHGYTGAGKDEVAGHMNRVHKFRKVAFADAVKRDLVRMFDVPANLFEDRRLKGEATPLLALARTNDDDFINWFIGTAGGEMELAHLGSAMLNLPRSPRWMMQHYGTDYRRAMNERHWIGRLEETISTFPVESNIVISDVRFPNEADFVKAESQLNEVWEVIRMNNPHHNKSDAHLSNLRLPSVDKVIFNSGTINQLWRKVDRAVEKVL